PCNPEETNPDYDEIVIWNSNQILPRYLVYYSRITTTIDTNQRHILWVDPNTNNNVDIKAEIEANGVKVKMFSTSGELMAYLSNASREANIRIISNGFRSGDGEESAGVRLCQWLQQNWNHVPFMLYCSNKSLVKDLPKNDNFVFLTDKP